MTIARVDHDNDTWFIVDEQGNEVVVIPHMMRRTHITACKTYPNGLTLCLFVFDLAGYFLVRQSNTPASTQPIICMSPEQPRPRLEEK